MKKLKLVSKKLVVLLISFLLLSGSAKIQAQEATRSQWLSYMDKLARPVMSNIAVNKLIEVMPVELSEKIDNAEHRKKVAYLEAFARTLSGISPWLNSEGGSDEEIALRIQYREWALAGIKNAVDTSAKDYLLWSGYQPLVDASFFALALNRCPWLWENLDEKVRENVITALKASRTTIPVYTNWILFTGMVEAFFCKYDIPYDAVRIEYSIREFAEHWYIGDGMYSDGMHFKLDYYNSYVIQPYLNGILDAVSEKDESFSWYLPDLEEITARYTEIQELSINTDGSFPVYGRSIVYRGGAFHHLADMTLRHKLPPSLQPAQVRCALHAVIQKTLDAPNTFTEDGWLNIGLHGHQRGLADFYINTGSLYLCSTIFLPLGLSAEDPFWTDAETDWTARKIWSVID